jgi:hypothetical protein
MHVFRLLASVLGVWSMLYFVQIVPGIGIFVIVIVHMLTNLMFFFPFTHIFTIYLWSVGIPPCYEQFKNHTASVYSTFLLITPWTSRTTTWPR